MSGLTTPIAKLARLLMGLLTEAQASGASVEVSRFAAHLRPLASGADILVQPHRGEDIPVRRYLDLALSTTNVGLSPLARVTAQLAPSLAWTQNPNYRRAPPSDGFLDNYGYAVIAGPEGGAPALARHPDLALGLLLLGPHTEYPAHHHPAAEVYIPFGVAEWRMADKSWESRLPGAVIHHPPNIAHATRSGDAPLAAIYLWTGDLATHARLTGPHR
jgi:Dimethlysulfonioproprionate lyase